MKKALLPMIALVLLTSCGHVNTNIGIIEKPTKPPTLIQPKHTYHDPNVVLDDNFNRFNSATWNKLDESGYKRLHYYLPKNDVVKDGKLHLIALKENHKGYPYTSGAVTTKGKVEMLYGHLEVRAKFPSGKGMFPAIWMLPASGAEMPEIDIAEMVGQFPTHLWNTVHWMKAGKHERSYTHQPIITPDLSKDFHTYGIIWTKDKLQFTFDGRVTFESSYVPHEPMYLYMNFAIGGVWVSTPDSNETFPKEMVVDYVKIFKN